MPFTPYHFGPGLLAKSVLPSAFSATAFVATQVAIDVETLYYIVTRQYPLHRTLHTFVGSTATGIVVAVALILARFGAERLLEDWANRREVPAAIDGERSSVGLIVGGVFGGVSHTILDAIVHTDVRPWAPLSTHNPFHGVVSWGDVELACVVAGLVGAVTLVARTAIALRAS